MRTFVRFGSASLLAIALVVLAPMQSAWSEEKKDAPPAGAGSIDVSTGKILTVAIDALNKEDYNGAKAAMAGMKMDKLSPYERSRVEQILASIDHAQENYDSARGHLQAAIAAGGLNEVEISNTRYQIAQLYLAQENWKQGAASLEEWFKTAPKPNSAAYYLLAVAYYQMSDFNRALPNAVKAVDLAEKPQESWIQLVLALHLQKDEFREAIPLLERLISMTPDKKTYWSQLSSVYGQLEDYSKSLAVLQVAYNAGMIIDDSEIRRLADLQLYNDVPYRCGMTIDAGLQKKQLKPDSKLYEKQANCWIAARDYDKSIAPLQRAGQLSASGDLLSRLGEVQVQRGDWAAAADAFQNALRKGGLRDPGNAQLNLGVALVNQKKYADAATWFQRASGNPKYRQMANNYLAYIKAQAG